MKAIFLSILVMFIVLTTTGCDPKVEERQARYSKTDCAVCDKGVCRYCEGSKECQHCVDGKRTTSTKNYTSAGIELVDIVEDCPHCKKTGKCHHCEGSGKCHQCDGKGTVEAGNIVK